jgi:peptidoglycan/LPS O-acetylase OafA/YrhL
VDLKAFYLRRILRIWPLYFFYLAAAMSFHWAFDPKGVPYASYVILFVLFMPNVAYSMRRYMPDTAPLWSIGIEEQFYALWPLVVSRVGRLEPLLIAVIISVLGLRTAMHVALGSGAHVATNIVESLGYDSMAIGALFAIWFRADNARLLRWAQSPFVHLAYAALVVLLIANRLAPLSLALNPITAVITAMFIVAQIAGRKKLLDLENPVLGYVGRISFGIYVYHMLVITLAVRIVGDRHVPGPAIIIGIAAASIALASLSYRVLEAPFLRLKDRLAHIKTTR